jgi:hypothetical protein
MSEANLHSISDAIVRAIEAGQTPTTSDGRNLMAVMLGRLGAVKGGQARQASMSKKEKTALAKKASAARWGQLSNC